MQREVVKANLVVFIASFCTLVIELVAGRIMAPYVGVSLYTWTSIIGVVLAGISLGAYLGGLLADRFPKAATLGWLLLLSGLSAFAIAPLADYIGAGDKLSVKLHLATNLMSRTLLITTLIFFLPALFLGMISPVVVKLTVKNLAKTGNVVGKIYAFSTLGSILGTFVTGFFLVSWLGTRTILFSIGVVLVMCAPIFGDWFARNKPLRSGVVLTCAALLLGLGLLLGMLHAADWPWLTRMHDVIRLPSAIRQRAPTEPRVIYFKESNYYALKIYDYSPGTPYHLRTLVLDSLIHSETQMKDPLHLEYPYLRIYDELVEWASSKDPHRRSLFLGGGGYTLPRCFLKKHPEMPIDVAEIDPEVTRVAHDFLDVPRDEPRLRTFNLDARWYVQNCREHYDFIFGDAFNDVSIPYHLTTKEFDQLLKDRLKPGGMLMALVIDSIEHGQFLPSYLRTLEEVFGVGQVHLLTLEEPNEMLDNIDHATCIVVGGKSAAEMVDFEHFLAQQARFREAVRTTLSASWPGGDGGLPRAVGLLGTIAPHGITPSAHVVRLEVLQKYLVRRSTVVLTDDYVPVDNLIAPLFEERFRAFEERRRAYRRQAE